MKKYILTFIFTTLLLIFAISSFGQGPPQPPGTGHSQTGNQIGGNAPVGGGIGILLVLGAAYGCKKVYDYLQDKKEEEVA